VSRGQSYGSPWPVISVFYTVIILQLILKIGWRRVDWFKLTQHRDQWHTVVNMVPKLLVQRIPWADLCG
jgi:hypothetical protein